MTQPVFTSRHYRALAQLMQSCHPQECPENDNQWTRNQWGWTVQLVAQMLRADNPLQVIKPSGTTMSGRFARETRLGFDHERFIKACQPGANVRARK